MRPAPPLPDGRGTLRPGARVAERYVVERRLGGGSMGTVYEVLGTDGEHLALKTLSRREAKEDPVERAERRARFLREAAVCSAIRHPNVVPVVDHGVDARNGVPYLVMPLLKGEDLAAVLDRTGCLQPDVAVALIVQACEGLSAVHAAGVVHRDVKPSNLFLETRENRVVVRVTDFGLAKWNDHAPGALTATGRFMGTPHYVSPEQAVSAKDADVRSDVFGLGMSLYHALAGAPAFAYARSFMALVLEITSREAPPVQDDAPWVPAKIARVVHASLLRDVRARCPSVNELALALDLAAGIDASRSPVELDLLRAPSEAQRKRVEPRASPPLAWEELLRV